MKVAASPWPVKVDQQTLQGCYPCTVRPVTDWATGVPMMVPLPLNPPEYKMPRDQHCGKRRELLQEYMIKHGAQTKVKQS